MKSKKIYKYITLTILILIILLSGIMLISSSRKKQKYSEEFVSNNTESKIVANNENMIIINGSFKDVIDESEGLSITNFDVSILYFRDKSGDILEAGSVIKINIVFGLKTDRDVNTKSACFYLDSQVLKAVNTPLPLIQVGDSYFTRNGEMITNYKGIMHFNDIDVLKDFMENGGGKITILVDGNKHIVQLDDVFTKTIWNKCTTSLKDAITEYDVKIKFR